MIKRYSTFYTNEDDINEAVVGIARKAIHSLDLVMYSFTYAPLANVLVELGQLAGFDRVSVITDKTQAAGASQKPLMARLRQSGVHVVETRATRGGIMHTKAMLINVRILGPDHPDSFVAWGSHNITESAAKQENLWQTDNDPGVCRELLRRYDAYLALGKRQPKGAQ
jgi:phosphatidylserine/phosphatidylglycerophosphate/cardiolipin synthase-like enzyme